MIDSYQFLGISSLSQVDHTSFNNSDVNASPVSLTRNGDSSFGAACKRTYLADDLHFGWRTSTYLCCALADVSGGIAVSWPIKLFFEPSCPKVWPTLLTANQRTVILFDHRARSSARVSFHSVILFSSIAHMFTGVWFRNTCNDPVHLYSLRVPVSADFMWRYHKLLSGSCADFCSRIHEVPRQHGLVTPDFRSHTNVNSTKKSIKQ